MVIGVFKDDSRDIFKMGVGVFKDGGLQAFSIAVDPKRSLGQGLW